MISGIVLDLPSPAAPAVADADPQQAALLLLRQKSRSALAGLTAPPWPARARPHAPADAETQQFAAVVQLPTVADLCAEHVAVCASAVDPLEIASALEFDGISDNIAAARYGLADVFALAEEMFRQVPRSPAEPEPPLDPWRDVSKFRPALHGLLYGLPAVCFPAAAGLLIGPGAVIALVVSLLVSWSTSQALAYLGYLRLGRTDSGQAQQVLRAGLAAGLAILVLVMASTAVARARASRGDHVLPGPGGVHAGRLRAAGARCRAAALCRPGSRGTGQCGVHAAGPAPGAGPGGLGRTGRHPAAGARAGGAAHQPSPAARVPGVRPGRAVERAADRRVRAGRGRAAGLPGRGGGSRPRSR